ncbi:uncharacterized protein DS421_19g657680 [Arachis hypogaea]|uniref:Uncharacterized protein n=1 Tax=Arachis hypogaea TaxID=3818 RepID=A0A6B9VAG8_ARAHY|nr:uncharacterized protein DS421_19g657680 [Arachis hypogaea]
MVHLPGKSSALGKSFGQELWFPFLPMCCTWFLVTREQSSLQELESSLQELESSWQELYLSLRSLVQVLGGALVELISLAQEKPPKSCFLERWPPSSWSWVQVLVSALVSFSSLIFFGACPKKLFGKSFKVLWQELGSWFLLPCVLDKALGKSFKALGKSLASDSLKESSPQEL